MKLIIAFVVALSALVVNGNYGPIAIEIKLESFENAHGIRQDGTRCDWFSDCDHILRFHIDTESASDPWPGRSRAIVDWYALELPAQRNLVTLDKTMIARRNQSQYQVDSDDVLANMRVLAEDLDDITKHDLIERFDCGLRGRPADSPRDSLWTPPPSEAPMQCQGELHYGRPTAQRPTLYFRHRMYKTGTNPIEAMSGGATPIDVRVLSARELTRVLEEKKRRRTT